MKILEIGAGTGLMTDVMIQMLGDDDESRDRKYAQWDYTDTSDSFFAGAQDRFCDEASRMSFKKLDIEKDPKTQDFECGTYDVVVASLVSLVLFLRLPALVHDSFVDIFHSRHCMPRKTSRRHCAMPVNS